MTHGHGFWFLLVWACVVWYSTTTVYVSVRGLRDIRRMLRDLVARGERRDGGD
ncbi:MAG: hypothetical protein ABMA01_05995 [Chthoniobacteraceae bacterium]|jgi:hypothetical protein